MRKNETVSVVPSLAGGILAFFSFTLPWVDQASGVISVKFGAWQASSAIVLSLVVVVIGIYLLSRESGIKAPLISLSLIMIFAGGIFFVVTLLYLVNTEVYIGVNVCAISFIASIIVLGTIILMFNQGTRSIPLLRNLAIIGCCVGCCVGLCCFLVLFYMDKYAFGIEYENAMIKYGAFLTAIGYMIVIVGQLLYPESNGISNNRD